MRKVNKQSDGYKSRAQLKKEKKLLKKQSQMEKKFLVGIYDDYRKEGKLNNILFNNPSCKLIGSYTSEPDYTMYENNTECVVETDGSYAIKIEVWEISESYLDKLEKHYNYYSQFEEYDQDYVKEKVVSPFGEIIMYFTNIPQLDENIIVSGDWIEYLNYVKVIGNRKENIL